MDDKVPGAAYISTQQRLAVRCGVFPLLIRPRTRSNRCIHVAADYETCTFNRIFHLFGVKCHHNCRNTRCFHMFEVFKFLIFKPAFVLEVRRRNDDFIIMMRSAVCRKIETVVADARIDMDTAVIARAGVTLHDL